MTATATQQLFQSLTDLAAQLDLPPLALVDAQQAIEARAQQEAVLGHEYNWCAEALSIGRQLNENPAVSFVDSGSTRSVFTWEQSNAVVKVPVDWRAARYNQLEVAYYEKSAFYGHPVLPCRLVWTSNGIPLVVMEKVTVGSRYASDMPAWGSNNDGGQVAHSPLLGTMAAYDATFPLFDWEPYTRQCNPMDYREGAEYEYQRLVTDYVL